MAKMHMHMQMQMRLTGATLQTLIILWVFTWLAMFLMAARLIMRKVRRQKFDISDKITMICMALLMARLAFVHVVIIWGTNNVPEGFRRHHQFSGTEIYQREIGSKLILASRTVYNTYLWLQKCVVLLLYNRILGGLQHTGIIVKAYWAILAVTYVVIQVVVFTDCKPLYLYWQVVPDPGICSEAIGELLILCGLNIFTDILLIVLPLPTLLSIRSSFGAKLRLVSLFCLGIFIVIITVVRLPFNFRNADMQVNRTTWASVEAFTAAFVANIPALYTLRKPLPNKPSVTERLSGAGWMEAGRMPATVDEIKKQRPQRDEEHQQNPFSKKSVEIQERRKGLFIPPMDDEAPGGWDRRARIRDGKVQYMGGDDEWEKDRFSMDSIAIFSSKE